MMSGSGRTRRSTASCREGRRAPTSKLEDEGWWDDDEVARETNFDDFATYWGGGGLLIKLSDGDRAANKPGVLLDMKVVHLRGGEAEYLTEGDISIVDDVPVYDVSQSATDLTSYQLGVVLTF